MPVSYIVYGSVALLLITLLIFLVNLWRRKK
jgi:hypothetical protein